MKADTVFRGSSALRRGDLKSEGKGKLSFHFSGDCETVEVMFRTVVSVNQLSVLGAVADLCEEPASSIFDYPTNKGRPVAQEKPSTTVSPTDLVPMTNPLLTNDRAQGDLLREHEQKIEDLPEELQLMRVAPTQVS